MSPEEQPTILTPPPNSSRPAPVGWQSPSVEEMQAKLPQYEVLEVLGRGGMGAVYKARQKSLKRLVAIKILPLGLADDEFKFAERFQNEAQTMAAMNHPAIVSVYDFGETSDGLLYFVMEFVDGTDVQKMIQGSGRLSGEHALAVTAHVCDALAYAHKRGVIHRDIKPANILIDQEGHIKVADFGLAKMHDPAQTSGLTRTGTAMGTPDYVAPEVLSPCMVADHRADLYAVGVMLYQMLTGEVPRGMFKLPSQKGLGTDVRFDEIICKAMEQDREERYQSAMDVRQALDVILTTPQLKDDGTGIVSATQIPQKPAPQRAPAQKADTVPKAKAQPKKQSPAKMWLSIGGIVAVLGAAGFLLLGGKPKPQASLTTDTASVTAPSAKPRPPNKVGESPNPSATAPSVSAKGKEIDLLALVDPSRDAVVGKWSPSANGLSVAAGDQTTAGKGSLRLQLPYQPPEEYDFEIEFTASPATGRMLGQILSASARNFSLVWAGGAESQPLAGFEVLDGLTTGRQTTTTKPLPGGIESGRRYRSRVEVRRDSMRAFLDDKEVISRKGSFSSLSIDEENRLRDGLHLGLRTSRPVTYHKITVREVSGAGKVDEGAAVDASAWTDWLGLKLAAGDFAADGWVRSSNGVTTQREISGLRLLPPGTKNAAVRVTYVLQDSQGLMLNARERIDGKVRLGYCVIDKVNQLHLNRLKPDGRSAALQHVILPAEADRMAERTLEMRMIGNQITATLNGTFAGTATDDTLSEGEWTLVFMKGVLVKKVEVQPLDTVTAFRDVAVQGKSAAAWTDWLGPKLAAGGFKSPGWMREAGGITTSQTMQGIDVLPAATRDGVVRVQYIRRDSDGPQITIRETTDGPKRDLYVIQEKGNNLEIGHITPDKITRTLVTQLIPEVIHSQTERTLEFRFVGPDLTATLNGTFNIATRHEVLTQGLCSVVLVKNVLVKKVEVQPLDASP